MTTLDKSKLDKSKFSHLHGKERKAAYMKEWKLKNKNRFEFLTIRWCWMCKAQKPQSEFDRGMIYECKSCRKVIRKRRYKTVRAKNPQLYSKWMGDARKRSTEWRIRNREAANKAQRNSYHKHPERRHAQYIVKKSLKSGALIRPNKCSKCLSECKPNAHHPDYSKPTKVIWLCHKCHKNLHYDLRHRTN